MAFLFALTALSEPSCTTSFTTNKPQAAGTAIAMATLILAVSILADNPTSSGETVGKKRLEILEELASANPIIEVDPEVSSATTKRL